MTLKFYDPRGPNLLNGSSCSGTRCLWNCFPWDVMPVNVTVLTGLMSPHSRKDLPLVQGQTSEEMTVCVLPQLVHTFLLWLSLSLSSFSISYSEILCYSLPLLFHPAFTSHSALLCPGYHGYCLLRMRWGGSRTDGRYRGLWYSFHSSLSISLSSKSLSLSSLQLTIARG